MLIPDTILEIKYPPDTLEVGREEIDMYQKHMAQIWHYERWSERANKYIPQLATRIFRLRNKHYTGCGSHYMMERKLGYILTKINNFDDCQPTKLYVRMDEMLLRVLLDSLSKQTVKAEIEWPPVDVNDKTIEVYYL